MDIAGKIAVVTGGASGLGRGTVERFIADGAKVAIFDMNDKLGAEVAELMGDNCDYYNRQQLRTFAKEQQRPVIAFDAQHEGASHDEGMQVPDEEFSGLSKCLELAVGAPVLLTHNLAVKHGLVNGSQGEVVDIVYGNGHHSPAWIDHVKLCLQHGRSAAKP